MYPELLRKLSTNRKNGLHAISEKNSDKRVLNTHLCARIGRFKGQNENLESSHCPKYERKI